MTIQHIIIITVTAICVTILDVMVIGTNLLNKIWITVKTNMCEKYIPNESSLTLKSEEDFGILFLNINNNVIADAEYKNDESFTAETALDKSSNVSNIYFVSKSEKSNRITVTIDKTPFETLILFELKYIPNTGKNIQVDTMPP